MLKIFLVIIFSLFSIASHAAYESTEVLRIVKHSVNGDLKALTIHYAVNDSDFPKEGGVSPLRFQIVIRGKNLADLLALTNPQKKVFIWQLIRPDIQHFYRTLAAQPVEVEEDDVANASIGILTEAQP